ncbi:Cox20p NDAI_0C05000 [Naumovozyma dairenensis CBS 421]|uniref:Cytochrome c oxidase assembly protein COX20, mitochondrial n=1 Tax=Naumovozyma dairenensis (strain ATCC 10597 / BCRC 20456 / CBS 421 / NBRC 0211 / NRRL Y-12639) TaxID=1071378 RepID=G0W8P8_NAUDC|nr:hypothetical protein NDAI_0C05000 [Naumovozyma dairenensis CBS 421]CCD24159.1 hypothetical protein NDAI_0C05000 [Naumovozyma dairenensis CBS 421]
MGWFSSSSSDDMSRTDENNLPAQQQQQETQKQLTNYSTGQKILLQDTPPKFNDSKEPDSNPNSIDSQTLKQAWNSIQWKDFNLEKLSSIPCFRDSTMVGFSTMFITSSIIFIYSKNPIKATNWGLGSLILGSMVGWEQCRLKRKHSFQIAQLAINTVKAKEKPMMNKINHDERLITQWENNAKTETLVASKKKWYQFW